MSLKGFSADADDARPAARGTRPIAGSNCHPAVGSEDGNGKGFSADADDARPAARGTRPIQVAGSNCHPAVGSEDRKWESEFERVSS